MFRKFCDMICDKLLDKKKEEYYMMKSEDRELLLRELKRKDERFSSASYFALFLTLVLMGFYMWTIALGGMLATDLGIISGVYIIIPYMIFLVFLFLESAAMRTNSRTAPVVFAVTAVIGTIIVPVFAVVIIWLILYLPTWRGMQAMREIPGYPSFAPLQKPDNEYVLSESQFAASDRKRVADMDDPQAAMVKNNENLEKILNGEMSLDEYFDT